MDYNVTLGLSSFLYLPGNAGLNTPKTFGVPLDELLQRNPENSEIPYVLERITEYIVCYGELGIALSVYCKCSF